MEKSRAIDLLDNLIGMIEDNQDNDYDTALRMAIEALKAQLSQEGTTSDMISRQAAIRWVKTECNPYGKPTLDFESGKKVIKHLEQMPPAQPEPHEGHWIRTDCGLDVECKCSRCGYKDFVEPGDEYWFNRNFCPNCGADMRGEKDG